MQYSALLLKQRVTIGSLDLEHLLPILLGVLFSIGFILYAKKTSVVKRKDFLFNALTLSISATVVVFHVYHLVFSNYNFRTDLPLYLCSLMALVIPLFSIYKRYWMFEILVFWIIAGTIQGVITPDIAVGFPSFDYFRYWIVHLGLLSVIFYAIVVFGMKPRFKSVFISFGALQIYVAFMVIINILMESNYFYLNEKPKSATLLDYFGEWPYYIIVVQLIITPLFLLIYLPFYFTRNKS
ncbi:TIGR02206 family membrane protein [Psychroserpens sp. XS_ASV72]|uniref:YwaF family protein n=1 Tax=Psychroserpens sp. XS_ASV72 TaxID=3241293 RepID=UPI00351869B4